MFDAVVVEEATVVVEEAAVAEPEDMLFIGGFFSLMLGLQDSTMQWWRPLL